MSEKKIKIFISSQMSGEFKKLRATLKNCIESEYPFGEVVLFEVKFPQDLVRHSNIDNQPVCLRDEVAKCRLTGLHSEQETIAQHGGLISSLFNVPPEDWARQFKRD
ncbi:MAG: hypothetical protein V1822_03565 [Candidatus Micrarchaeota archaeon]